MARETKEQRERREYIDEVLTELRNTREANRKIREELYVERERLRECRAMLTELQNAVALVAKISSRL